MKLSTICLLLLSLFPCLLYAEEFQNKENNIVFSKSGNIYYALVEGYPIQITSLGKDSSPVLSSNKEMIAFVRIGGQVVPEGCDGDTKTKYGEQIWIYNILTKKERLLVQNNFKCNNPEEQIIDPKNLLFSPDNKQLYFITSAWVTSGALHSVQIDDAKLNYIVPANEFNIVTKGENKGDLIVYQHRYFIGGGAYDWYWLINPESKVEGAIGPEITKDQMDFIEN